MPKVGVSNLYYAKLIGDSAAGVVYDTPVRLAGLIDVNRQVASESTTLYADNGAYATASALGEITLEMNLADIPLQHQAVLLGHTIEGGILKAHKDDTAPYVALMFEGLLDDGKRRFKKLLKGKFSIPDDNYATKGETVEYQQATISATFVVREYDGLWEKTADEGHPDYVPSIGENWYTSVEPAADTTAPTVTCVPADAATGVVVDASIVLTFSEAITASSLVVGESFILQKADGTQVAGAGAWDIDHEVYTYNPTVDLSAATDYVAIVTRAVKDLAGNKLAAVNVFNFTTA